MPVATGQQGGRLTEHRGIRSFVLRQGRISNAQRRAHGDLLPVYGLPYSKEPVDLDAAFGRPAPTIFEIGSGMGETTAAIAAAHPERNFVATEVHTPGVGSLLKLIAELELQNVRVVQHDAIEVLHDMIRPGVLAGVHVFFPDPWPKKRHHKRRLIQPEFVSLLASRIASGGYIHLATDWEEYAVQILEVLRAEQSLRNTAESFAERGGRPQTKFEARGLRLGHRVCDLVFRKL